MWWYWKEDVIFIFVPLQAASANVLDDNFFELLSRCQGNRMEEQRAELPNSKTKNGGKTILCFPFE